MPGNQGRRKVRELYFESRKIDLMPLMVGRNISGQCVFSGVFLLEEDRRLQAATIPDILVYCWSGKFYFCLGKVREF